jgi:hypothetical protein
MVNGSCCGLEVCKGVQKQERSKWSRKKGFTPVSCQPYRIVNKWPPGQVGDSQYKMQLYNYFHWYNTVTLRFRVKEEKDVIFNKVKNKKSRVLCKMNYKLYEATEPQLRRAY